MTENAIDDDAVRMFVRARDAVLERIAAACSRAGRQLGDVTLVAVSKTVPVEVLRAAVAAGLTVLGENRVQEAEGKAAALRGVSWHLVGPLQSNKARRALNTFDLIQSVDSLDLALRLDSLLATGAVASPFPVPFPVLLQVNVDQDPDKAGFDAASLSAAAESLDAIRSLEFRGLMTIGRLVERAEDARPTFAALRDLSSSLRARWPRLGGDLSMGMSEDYPIAVEEGATIVRVGRALFGERRTT